jgi:hypothetical protein
MGYNALACSLPNAVFLLDYSYTLKIEAIYSCELPVDYQRNTRALYPRRNKELLNAMKVPKVKGSSVDVKYKYWANSSVPYIIGLIGDEYCETRANASPSNVDTCDVSPLGAVTWDSMWF